MPAVVVTIDGPAGAGKSTVARKLAKTLNFVHLNSGALFRALGMEAVSRALPLDDDSALAELAQTMDFRFVVDSAGGTQILVNGQDLGGSLLGQAAGELASQVGVLPGVRKVFEDVQREVAERESLVVEGRDAGTVVFPNARFKFFIDAHPEIRAKRRYLQLHAGRESSEEAAVKEIQRELEVRDHRDSTREIAPQKAAEDATVVDTSQLSVDEVVERLRALVAAGLDKNEND